MEITFKDGQHGTIDDPIDSAPYADVRLADGRLLRVDRSLIQNRDDRGVYVPLDTTELSEGEHRTGGTREEVVVPVIGEELQVHPEKREIGSVRINKTVQEHEEIIDQPVIRERVDVKRIAINQVVNGPIPVRQMGDTMIIPLVEEVLRIERQLILKEEIHVTKIRTEERIQQPVTVRREDAQIERFDESGEAVPVDVPRAAEPIDTRGATSEVDVPRTRPTNTVRTEVVEREHTIVRKERARPTVETGRIRKNKLIK